MGTTQEKASALSTVPFGKTRSAVLALLFGRPDERFHVRAIVRAVGVGSGSVQRELKTLAEADILERAVEGRQVYYQANRRSPIFEDLCALVAKTVGLADVVRSALEPLGHAIRVAFIYGSGARGAMTVGSDVDVFIIGSVPFADVVEALQGTQDRLGRELNPSVVTPTEWTRRLERGDHLPTAISEAPKIFLMGDEDELAGLAHQ